MTTTASERPIARDDETRCERLRAQLRVGCYRVSEELVAEAIVQRLLGRRGQ